MSPERTTSGEVKVCGLTARHCVKMNYSLIYKNVFFIIRSVLILMNVTMGKMAAVPCIQRASTHR